MTRATPSTMLTELRETAIQPVTLLEISTGDVGTPYIRLTNNDSDLSWSGSTFTARPFAASAVELDAGNHRGIQIECADVDDYFKGWLVTTAFVHQKMSVYVVDRGDWATGDCLQDTFRITHRTRGPGTFTLHGEPLVAILARLKFPARSLTREDFPGIQRLGSDR